MSPWTFQLGPGLRRGGASISGEPRQATLCVPAIGSTRTRRLADVAWGIIFERTVPFGMVEPARHPSQLYEAGLEGVLLFALLWFAFWKTKARYDPGKLVGLFVLGYGVARFTVEFFREPDSQLRAFAEHTGLHMGQWLCVPMIVGGAYLVATSAKRRVRVEPIAGTASVA